MSPILVHSCRLTQCFLCVLQVSSSVLSNSGEGAGSVSAVKYPGQDSLYTTVGLTQSADVASVRGEPWCPMALAWTCKSSGRTEIPGLFCLESGCCGSNFFSFLGQGAMFVFLSLSRCKRRKEVCVTLQALNRVWSIEVPDWCGESCCLKKKNVKTPGQTINSCCGGCLDLLSLSVCLSLPSVRGHRTQFGFFKESHCVHNGFLKKKKLLIGYQRFIKDNLDVFFSLLATTGIMPYVPRHNFYESKEKKIFINLPLLKTWLWLLIKISI